MYRAFKIASGIIIEEISRWAWHVPTYKTVEPIIRQCFFSRLRGILGYRILSYIPIYSVCPLVIHEPGIDDRILG